MDPSLISRTIDLAITIQQIPAPPFSEEQRAAFIYQRLQTEGLSDVTTDEIGNVYARLPGAGERAPLVISAHMDTVFPVGTDLSLKRAADKISGPGIGDNSLGVAGLFGLTWALQERDVTLPGDLWLVANVGEEGLGDLRGMKEVVKRFGRQPLAYIVLEGLSLGQIYHRGLGVQRYRITARTQGGHSWVDYGRPSAIHELAKLIANLDSLTLPSKPRTSLNVGVISGGTSVNTIAPEAHLELDLRSEDPETLAELTDQVKSIVQTANRPGYDPIEFTLETIGQRPAGEIPADHALVGLAARALEAQSCSVQLNIGSTDANVPLSHGLPAICLGLTIGSGAHTQEEFIYNYPLLHGLAQLVMVVETAHQELENHD